MIDIDYRVLNLIGPTSVALIGSLVIQFPVFTILVVGLGHQYHVELLNLGGGNVM